ncbi:hypothetical protein [Parablautia muri]|uniref:Lipoprotein n=1 Tax=Parablautia muri TaxID=2320879 RepID=A0A9X5BJ85_9FIRM|nr:hypothetical protein [Parablautia muri]NBJ95044.1 hypothetical protein [Parablautia muri]
MNKFIKLSILCGMVVCFLTGCADVVESSMTDNTTQENLISIDDVRIEDVAVMEEDYYVVEGILREIGKEDLLLETPQGQSMYFKLAPETIIYAGEGSDAIAEGENIKVVFDGELNGTEMKKVFVIAVTVLEEDF